MKILNNYYPQKLSVAEAFGKELRYIIASIGSWFYHKGSVKRILALPDLPGSKSILFKVARKNRWVITNHPKKKCIMAIAWKDATIRDRLPLLEQISSNTNVLNLHCNNIMKTYVDDFVYEVFGFKTRIDPLKHHGPAVVKSEWNATHSGKIVHCPIHAVENESIYQLVINNKTNDDWYEDIRIPVAGNIIPFVYIKLKSTENRFETKAAKVLMKTPGEVLSPDEQKKVIAFAKIIGLDFGEVDALRNRDDGRLYVVDVNNTPYGPPANLSSEDSQNAITRIAEVLQRIQ